MAKKVKGADQLRELAGAGLAAGEEIVGVGRASYNGTIQPNRMTVNSFLADLDAPPPAPDPDAVVLFPTAPEMGIVATGGRLLVWSIGFGGKPKAYLGEVPVSAVDDVIAGQKRLGATLGVVMKSGARIDLEFSHKDDDGSELIAALQQLTHS